MKSESEKLSIIKGILRTEPKKHIERVPYIERFKARFTFWYTTFCFFLVGSLVFVQIPPANKDTLITLTGILIGSGLIMILAHWFKRVVDQIESANKDELEAIQEKVENLLMDRENKNVE